MESGCCSVGGCLSPNHHHHSDANNNNNDIDHNHDTYEISFQNTINTIIIISTDNATATYVAPTYANALSANRSIHEHHGKVFHESAVEMESNLV